MVFCFVFPESKGSSHWLQYNPSSNHKEVFGDDVSHSFFFFFFLVFIIQFTATGVERLGRLDMKYSLSVCKNPPSIRDPDRDISHKYSREEKSFANVKHEAE